MTAERSYGRRILLQAARELASMIERDMPTQGVVMHAEVLAEAIERVRQEPAPIAGEEPAFTKRRRKSA